MVVGIQLVEEVPVAMPEYDQECWPGMVIDDWWNVTGRGCGLGFGLGLGGGGKGLSLKRVWVMQNNLEGSYCLMGESIEAKGW